YTDMERFFDAELRAIAAHVLFPVGERATRHVLETYTAQAWKTVVDMERLHGTEIRGSGWLVMPIKEPAEWTDGDADRLVEAIRQLRSTDFRRETDLGRFIAGSDPYYVR
ncbi:MAG: uracil-DNA glycosylase, partial [Halohasta sp.]